jgi:hypothetical protein
MRAIITHDVEVVGALVLACLYLALASGHLHSVDGLLMYYQARALAYHGSLHFTTPIVWGQPNMTSRYGLGLSLLYVPGLLALSWLRPYAPVVNPQSGLSLLYDDPLYTAVGTPINVAVTAASAYLVGRFVRALGRDRRAALWGMMLYGIASPAIVYAREDFAQPLEGLCWIAALYSAVEFRRSRRMTWLWACSFSMFYAVLTRPFEGSLLLIGAMLLSIVVWPPRRWTVVQLRASSAILAGYAAGILVTVLVNWGRYGSPFTTGYEGLGWTTPLGMGLAGSLVSPGRGILWEFPAILLIPFGLRDLWRTKQRIVGLVLLGLSILLLVSISAWSIWWGGWNWGLRLFVPALPALSVLAAYGVASLRSSHLRWVPWPLLAAGVIWAVPCILTDFIGGYAPAHRDPLSNWRWDAYPPLGAWQYLYHPRALSPMDFNSIDILWFRVARSSHNASLIPMLVLLIVASLLTATVIRRLRAAAESHSEERASNAEFRSTPYPDLPS